MANALNEFKHDLAEEKVTSLRENVRHEFQRSNPISLCVLGTYYES
jgi:hypothetical protein